MKSKIKSFLIGAAFGWIIFEVYEEAGIWTALGIFFVYCEIMALHKCVRLLTEALRALAIVVKGRAVRPDDL